MKKILSIFVLLISAMTVLGQTVTLTFTGRDANNRHCQLNRVVIANQTKNWQETIYWPDTTLIMQQGTNIEDYVSENAYVLSQNNPNPFHCETEANLTIASSGEIIMEITDVNGRCIASSANTLLAGTHQYRIQLASAGIYFLTARQNSQASSIKMVNNGNGSINSVEYVGTDKTTQTLAYIKNRAKGSTRHPFSFGDKMEYVGYATINGSEVASQSIEQKQEASQTFTLQFSVAQIFLPTVTTDTISNITTTTATCGGNVTDDGGVAVTDRGVCYDTTRTPTIASNCLHIGAGMGTFSQELTELLAGTTYYVRAYATNSTGTAYGNTIAFTTLPKKIDILPCPNAETLTDIDGNTYNTVQIGSQCWMKENLKTTRYSDGTAIPQGNTYSYEVGYWYYPNNNATNKATYGLLYNWKAVMHSASSSITSPSGVQGICPAGWHVPSDGEWTLLIETVSNLKAYWCNGNRDNIAKALASTTGWDSDDGNCTVGNTPENNDDTGFSAVPAGYYSNKEYAQFGSSTFYWSATQNQFGKAFCHSLFYNYTLVRRLQNYMHRGLSVRCICD